MRLRSKNEKKAFKKLWNDNIGVITRILSITVSGIVEWNIVELFVSLFSNNNFILLDKCYSNRGKDNKILICIFFIHALLFHIDTIAFDMKNSFLYYYLNCQRIPRNWNGLKNMHALPWYSDWWRMMQWTIKIVSNRIKWKSIPIQLSSPHLKKVCGQVCFWNVFLKVFCTVFFYSAVVFWRLMHSVNLNLES
jgi:hypothetical protein